MTQGYALVRSRRKTLAVHIKSDGAVEVRAPLRLAKSEIERFVASKSGWIEKKQTEVVARQPTTPRKLPPPQYASGEFERVVRELVGYWEQRLGVSASYIDIRAMSSRWGSCTSRTRRIRLNSALEYYPRECLEYVIVHELAHLRENNHSSRFWAIVETALPNFEERQTKLRESQWILSAQGGNEE